MRQKLTQFTSVHTTVPYGAYSTWRLFEYIIIVHF